MTGSRRLLLVLGAVALSSPALASAELARSRNCTACHHAERRVIGPTYTAIAGRYADDAGAAERLAGRIIAGGGGNWGQTPMPAQPAVTREEAETLARWILSHR